MGRALIKLTEKDLGLKELQAFIEKYEAVAVRAGFLPSASSSTVESAAAHEFGAPAQGLPEQAIMRAAWQEHVAAYEQIVRKLVTSAVLGELDLEQGLERLGQQMVKDLGDAIAQHSEASVEASALQSSLGYEVVREPDTEGGR